MYKDRMTDYLVSPHGVEPIVISELNKDRAIDLAMMIHNNKGDGHRTDICVDDVKEHKPASGFSLSGMFSGKSFKRSTIEKKIGGANLLKSSLINLTANGMRGIETFDENGPIEKEDIANKLLHVHMRYGLPQFDKVTEFIFKGYDDSANLLDPKTMTPKDTEIIERILEINPNDPSIVSDVERNGIINIQSALKNNGGYLNRDSFNFVISESLADIYDSSDKIGSDVIADVMERAHDGLLSEGGFKYQLSLLEEQSISGFEGIKSNSPSM